MGSAFKAANPEAANHLMFEQMRGEITSLQLHDKCGSTPGLEDRAGIKHNAEFQDTEAQWFLQPGERSHPGTA